MAAGDFPKICATSFHSYPAALSISTFSQDTYYRLDPVLLRDRAGRQTLLQYDAMRQLSQRTDPLNRVTRYEWCSCGDLKSVTDPMGRTTAWNKDVQGRVSSKQFADGSQITYSYENSTSRLQRIVDERRQVTEFSYNPDNTVRSVTYPDATVLTPTVTYTYDPDYARTVSMSDGIGRTTYPYNPITSSPALGAGLLAGIDGPLTNDTITFMYDELGRRVQASINGAVSTRTFDAASRIVGVSNALGNFALAYDGATTRLILRTYPNGMAETRAYLDNVHDDALQQISYAVGSIPVSQFNYGFDIPRARITAWTRQAGTEPPSTYNFAYDDADQLVSGSVTNSGALTASFAYSYDAAGNRLTELAGGVTKLATYNALNQISLSADAAGVSRTNEWDAANRLTAVTDSNARTELAYDGLGRLASIRQLQGGSEVSFRRFVWCENEVLEERDASGANVTKRYFQQGVRIEAGSNAGAYFYTRDHLGSIRELTDGGGNVRARYAYDPFGRRTQVTGDVAADFGFAGMLWSAEVSLNIARFRAYDPEVGRWLSRDPLQNAEADEGPNLYLYAAENPVNVRDPLGLCCENEAQDFLKAVHLALRSCAEVYRTTDLQCQLHRAKLPQPQADKQCALAEQAANRRCDGEFFAPVVGPPGAAYSACRARPCKHGSYCIPEEPLVPTFVDLPWAAPLGTWHWEPYGPSRYGD